MRNSLGPENVKKLVYIKTNYAAVAFSVRPCESDDDSDLDSPFRLIQTEFFTLNAETFLQIKRQIKSQIVFMVLLWFYYGFIWCFENPEVFQK
jgi:hypothetical protein